jgi:predicted dehydrogenase
VQAVIVGAGGSGALHALAFRAAGVRVVAVYDPDEARARAVADVCGARTVGSLAAAASVDADLAAVCSPPSVHVAQAMALATSGRTVFVEKPVATSLEELERLAALPRCVPIVQWRAGRALRALRRAIAFGELGPSPVVSCELAWGRSDAYFRARKGPEWGAGATLSVGIHALDALTWALEPVGEPESAAALATSSRTLAYGDTAAVAILGFGRASAMLRISLDGGADTTRIVACGRGVTAELSGGEADPTGTVLRWAALDAGVRPRLEALERTTPGALGSPLLVPYLVAAIAAIKDGATPGETQRLPSIADVFAAHVAALRIGGPASGEREVKPDTILSNGRATLSLPVDEHGQNQGDPP